MTLRVFVATRYRSASAASSPPMPSSSASTRNAVCERPVIGRSLAKAYLASQDPKLLSRTWQDVMEEFCPHGKPETQAHNRSVSKSEPQNQLRNEETATSKKKKDKKNKKG